MVHYKLVYFDDRSRGEPSRLILSYAGAVWTNHVIPYSGWPANDDNEYKQKAPFGQLPILELDNGQILAQSNTIARYLARTFNLCGKNDWEAARCDMLVDGIEDVYKYVRAWFIEKDPAQKEKNLKSLLEEEVPKTLQRYSNFLAENESSGFYVGDSVTWADLYCAEWMSFYELKSPGILERYPLVAAHVKRIHSIPNISKWIEQRPPL